MKKSLGIAIVIATISLAAGVILAVVLASSRKSAVVSNRAEASIRDKTMIYVPLPSPEDSEHPGGYCMDGSRAGYFVREKTNPNSNVFVIYLRGGGGCRSKEECDARPPNLRGNSTWPNAMIGKKFLDPNCTVNPTFCEGTAVHVPYCTSDGHMGNNTEASEDTWGYYFDGHANVAFVVEELIAKYGLGEPGVQVLLTGSSAGGIGTFYNVDWVAKRLNAPERATVKAISTSGWYFPTALDLPNDVYPPTDYPHFANGTSGNQFYDAIQSGNAPLIDNRKVKAILPEDCVNYYGDENWWACQSTSNLYRFLKSSIFLAHSQYDKNQMVQQMMMPAVTEDEQDLDLLEVTKSYMDYWGSTTRASFDRILNGEHDALKPHPDGLFSASCVMHGMAWDLAIGEEGDDSFGVPWSTIAHDWFFQLGNHNTSHQLVEECAPADGKNLPCNKRRACQFPYQGKALGKVASNDNVSCVQEIALTGCVESFGSVKECQACLRDNIEQLEPVCDVKIDKKVCMYASKNDISKVSKGDIRNFLNN